MDIQVITICYNESMRILDFLTHYHMLDVDKIIVYDNESTDNTVELCNEFNKHFANIVEVRNYATFNQIRDDIYLSIKNYEWRTTNADWNIIVDCDELLELHPSDYNKDQPYGRLRLLLKKYEELGNIFPVVKGVQVVTDKFEDLQDESIKKFALDPSFNKRCIFTKELYPVYKPGCHDFVLDNPSNVNINRTDVKPLYLLHYKHIDIDYVVKRYEDFNSRLSTFNKEHNYGVQYQMSAEAIKLKFKYYKRFALTKEELFNKER